MNKRLEEYRSMAKSVIGLLVVKKQINEDDMKWRKSFRS